MLRGVYPDHHSGRESHLMKSKWSDKEAKSYVARYGNQGVNADLALRVYTSRLLGRDPALVLHGGGNTSVKTTVADLMGRATEILCVKGSGWDMAEIEPQGLPAVRIAPIRELRALDSLSDEDMVNAQRVNLLDAASPTPSVETLLHAFLPAKFVDHTHSTAVLSISDQQGGGAICRDVYGARMGYVPYIMPGFALAKAAAEAFERDPSVEGLILEKHGIFTFGETARESYDRMIEMVSLAEARIGRKRKARVFVPARLPAKRASVAEVAPILRGLLAERKGEMTRRMVLDFRTGPKVRAYVDGRDLARYSQQGVVTPDHTIRTKNWPVIVPVPAAGALDQFCAGAKRAFADFTAHYHAYFVRNNKRLGGIKKELDPMPRVILVPGLGLFGVGAGVGAARIAADIAVSTVETITDAESVGRFDALPERDLFDMEYWSLEQAKLGKGAESRLARHVVVVTGGASGIGFATAKAFRMEGAEVALLDIDRARVEAAAKTIGGKAIVCDVTKRPSVKAAFDAVATLFGGIDIVVSNAGHAWQGRIGDVDEKILRDSFDLNFYGHQRVAQAAVAVMRAQGTGGVLLFNISKQALNPGPDFGPYGLPKAAALALMRQYAIDHGTDGIRSNAVNADRIRSGLLNDAMIAERARARGISEGDYMSGNLLRREVLADDVAKVFVDLALSPKTTGAIVTVDGGNIAAAVR
jgi:rhamnose utilization protein RhaD (predicted bifunctional aldolase and dehydrogenase)/NAD(P)-dependent dehydrogenase (short-subunit alcohol dehydrogenase family)